MRVTKTAAGSRVTERGMHFEAGQCVGAATAMSFGEVTAARKNGHERMCRVPISCVPEEKAA